MSQSQQNIEETQKQLTDVNVQEIAQQTQLLSIEVQQSIQNVQIPPAKTEINTPNDSTADTPTLRVNKDENESDKTQQLNINHNKDKQKQQQSTQQTPQTTSQTPSLPLQTSQETIQNQKTAPVQEKEQASSKKPQQTQPESKPLKKDKQNKTVQITMKQLKKYSKLATEIETFKKENQNIKKQYNKVAKQLIATRQQLDKKSTFLKDIQNQLKSSQQKLKDSENSLKSSQNQLKALHEKNDKIQQQNINLSKRIKEEQKSSHRINGMQQTIKQLQKIIDVSTKNEHLFQREADKFKQMLRIEKEMNTNLKSEIDQLRHFSSEHFSLKQEVGKLLLQLKTMKDAKQQYPIMAEKYEHLQQINEKLKQKVKQLETRIQSERALLQKLQKKVDKLSEEKKLVEKRMISVLAEKQQREGQIQAFKMELDDQRTEIEVQRKRYTSEIKDLKLALHHEHQKLKLTEIQLMQSRKKEKQTVNLEGVKFTSLTKEDLFNLIEELQMKNASIKLNLNALLQEITLKDLKIKDLQATLMTLTRHIVKSLPNLDESEGMEYVERQVVETGKGKREDWGEIVEKVVIENLRLKNSVTALGEEFNMRMRSQMEKKLK